VHLLIESLATDSATSGAGRKLRPVGFWRDGDTTETQHLPEATAAVDPTWPLRERARVAAYLRSGRVIASYLGYSHCRFGCGIPWTCMGSGDLSDGTWVWPEGYAHYLEMHKVKPPDEFLEEIAPRLGWLPPWWPIAWWLRRLRGRWLIAMGRREAAREARLPPHTTPLVEACERGELSAVKALLEKIGAGVNQRVRTGETALHRAARAGRHDVVELLLAAGADVNARDDYQATPLVDARSADAAAVLLGAGAKVDPEPVAYMTPLVRAVAFGDRALVLLLLKAGADVNRRDRCGRTPLAVVRDLDMAQLLLERGADPRVGTPLINAVLVGNTALVRLLLERGAALDVKDSRGQTPLFHAATHPSGDAIVELLLGLGMDPRPANDMGDTALHQACNRTSLPVVEQLLAAGASVGTVSKNYMTPLHWAAFATERRADSAAVLARLIAAGAGPVDARDRWGRTPLAMAVAAGDVAAARVLLAAGADPHASGDDGSPASIAAASGRAELIALLRGGGRGA